MRRIRANGQLTPSDDIGLYLLARFTPNKKDICAEYYRVRGKRAPYLALAECGTDPQSILAFTAKWGRLTTNTSIPLGWKDAIGQPWCPWVGDQLDFLMDITGWLHLQERFQKLLALAAQPGRDARRQLCELITRETWYGFDEGYVHLGLEWKPDALKPQIVAGSLYLAFVVMLWLDIAANGRKMLRCADSECGKYFPTERSDKFYCSPECALTVARRTWWRKHGNEWRRRRTRQREGQIEPQKGR